MKYFVVFALCVAAASAFVIPPSIAGDNAAEIQQIIDAIYHPSTDPATAAALEQMLLDMLGFDKPEPADVGDSPILVIPEIIDGSIVSQPAENEVSPIEGGPHIIDGSIVSEPANYQGPPPLVQIIINVKPNVPGSPVIVEQPEIVPEEVIVVDKPEVTEPVIVAPIVIPEKPVVPSPVIVAPIEPSPAINLPEILN